MTVSEPDSGTTRDDLIQRLALMEQMIAEGRQYTGRNSWLFVLWGVVDLVALSWQHYFSAFGGRWAWVVCLPAGVILTLGGKALQRNRQVYSDNQQCTRVMSVWGIMGLALGIFIASTMLTHFDWQYTYMAAILMMIGMAHGISATFLRWRMQGLVATVYWAGGVAILVFNSANATNLIWLIEMGIVMIVFGLYAIQVESTDTTTKGRHQ
jgi:hypothetical protein